MNINNNCKKYENIFVYVTGYGPFMDIIKNPSQSLCENLCKNIHQFQDVFDEKCILKHKQILEVSVDYVKENIKESHSLIEEYCKNDIEYNTLHLIIHCGVFDSSKEVHLEKISKNFINDYCKYKNKTICEESNDLFLNCKLDLDNICIRMKEKGMKCITSEDAGKYLCNYVYHLSNIKFHKNSNVIPVFFHIPNIEEMKIEESLNILVVFIKEIKNQYVII